MVQALPDEIVAREVKLGDMGWTCGQRAEGEMADEVRDRNDELLRNFASSLEKHIHDALGPIFAHVVSVLRNRGKAERKQRIALALKKKNLALRALMSVKMQVERRRRARICRLRRRAFSEMSSRLRIRRGLRLLSLSE